MKSQTKGGEYSEHILIPLTEICKLKICKSLAYFSRALVQKDADRSTLHGTTINYCKNTDKFGNFISRVFISLRYLFKCLIINRTKKERKPQSILTARCWEYCMYTKDFCKMNASMRCPFDQRVRCHFDQREKSLLFKREISHYRSK
jgi:hypothetical protein